MKIMMLVFLMVISMAVGGCIQPQEAVPPVPTQINTSMETPSVTPTIQPAEPSQTETGVSVTQIVPSATTVLEISYSWYQNPSLGFRMKYPSVMTISNKTDVLGKTVGEKFSDPGGQTAAEVRVIYGVSKNLDDWIDTFLRESTGKGYTIQSEKKIQLNNNQAYEIIFTFSENHQELKALAILTIKNNNAYVLLFGSKSEKYNDYSGIFREMIDSFESI